MDTTLYRILIRPVHTPNSKIIRPTFFNVDSMTLTELHVKSEDASIYKISVTKTIFKSTGKRSDTRTGSKVLNKYIDSLLKPSK